jgi:hypothetical protein
VGVQFWIAFICVNCLLPILDILLLCMVGIASYVNTPSIDIQKKKIDIAGDLFCSPTPLPGTTQFLSSCFS